MSQEQRLANRGRIRRDKPLNFKFNNKSYQGYFGDTLASALLANNVHLVGRSFKYHRPRGIVGSGFDEPNALVQIAEEPYTIPNAMATQVELYDGLCAKSVNCWPNVKQDFGQVFGMLSRIMPPGFYYKTFKWPKSLFKTYEKGLRSIAGFGHSPTQKDGHFYEKVNAHCDLLVIGGGPVGIITAYEAANRGARVILVDNKPELGGSLLQAAFESEHQALYEWCKDLIFNLSINPDVKILTRTIAFGFYDHNFVSLLENCSDHLHPASTINSPRQRQWRIRAKHVSLATGALERPIAFANNDRPGIMLCSAVSTYINRFGVLPGKQVVLFTNNDSGYKTAQDLMQVGTQVVGIIDPRSESPAMQEISSSTKIYKGFVVADTEGKDRLKSITISSLEKPRTSAIRLECDLLCVSGGWDPLVHLGAHFGNKPKWDPRQNCFALNHKDERFSALGACKGNFNLLDSMKEGQSLAEQLCKNKTYYVNKPFNSIPNLTLDTECIPDPLYVVPDLMPKRSKKFIDFQNDVTAKDISIAIQEGFNSIEHIKRYTLLGFGTDQGRLGNIIGMGYTAQQLKIPIEEVGTTTFRPPFVPVSFGALVGMNKEDLFDPIRYTPIHEWHVKQGAVFEDVGQWKRPWYYPKGNETLHQAVNRECLATHKSVGILDGSTLGKIDIKGPDAGEFLNRVYTNAWKKLKIGGCRYGLMLNEEGMVFDDGVTVRLADDHYFMTTTTGGAAHVLAWLERWLQVEWPELKVYLTSVTDQFATIILSGPNSRKVLQNLESNIDFSKEAFPFMQSINGQLAGFDVRIMRMSFTGELSFEIYVPANYGQALWDKIIEAGYPFDITPYGTETMHVLRAEKGFIIAGQDTDGSVSPQDLGMNWIVSKKKDFIGKRSLSRKDLVRKNRKQLVGLLTKNPKVVLEEGAQIVQSQTITDARHMVGHVTSSYYSAQLEHSIALALIQGGHSRTQEEVFVVSENGKRHRAIISKFPFYDPEGKRQDV